MPETDCPSRHRELRALLSAPLIRVPPAGVLLVPTRGEAAVDLLWVSSQILVDALVAFWPVGKTTSSLLEIMQVKCGAHAMGADTTPP